MNYSESMLNKFKQCPRAAQFSYDIRLEKEKEDKDDHHLDYGSAGHESLAILYKGGTLVEAKQAFTKKYPKQLDEEDEAKTEDNWFNLLDWYSKGPFLDDMQRYKILSTELYDKFEFAGEEGFVVKLDLVIEDRRDGGIYGLDHKITGGKKVYLNQMFWNQFNPNSQITKYISNIKAKYGHCAGFFVNAFGMGFREKKNREGDPAGTWFKHQRMEFNRTPDQLAEEERDTQFWIEKVEQSKLSGYWAKNTQSCMFCEFRPLCVAGYTWPDDQELITITYKQKELHVRQ